MAGQRARVDIGHGWIALMCVVALVRIFPSSALICEVNAVNGLFAAAGGQTVGIDGMMPSIYALPLCRLPYLVNSQLPPRDVAHVGMARGGYIDINIEILPSTYVNNLPQNKPHYASGRTGEKRRKGIFAAKALASEVGESEMEESNYRNNEVLNGAASSRFSDRHIEFEEERQTADGTVERHLQFTDRDQVARGLEENPKNSWHVGMGMRRMVPARNLEIGGRSDSLRSHVNIMRREEKTTVWGEHLSASLTNEGESRWRLLEFRSAGDSLHGAASDQNVVASVNNTYVLVMDHLQYLVFDSQENWLPSFSASDGVVANSYLPSFKRFVFDTESLQVHVPIPRLDRYALILINADGLDLHIRGTITFVNPENQHLSMEQVHLPATAFFLMLVNLAACILLFAMYFIKWRGHSSVILGLFILNFGLSFFALLFDWLQSDYVQKHGVRPAGLWLASRVSRKLQDVVALLIFVLLSLGWQTLRPYISRVETQFVAGLCVISLYLGIFEIILGGFQETRYIFHAAGYVCVLVAIHFNLALVHGQLADASLTQSTGAVYPKFIAFKRYRWIFLAYLMKPVTLVFLKVSLLAPVYEQLLSWDEWLYVLVDNLLDFVVFAALCYDFRPVKGFEVFRHIETETADSVATETQRALVGQD